MKVYAIGLAVWVLLMMFLNSQLKTPAHAQAIDTGAVVLYTETVVATPDRQNVAVITQTAQAFLNEATCRNAQAWFQRERPSVPAYGVSTNSWCTIKVPN